MGNAFYIILKGTVNCITHNEQVVALSTRSLSLAFPLTPQQLSRPQPISPSGLRITHTTSRWSRR